MRRLAQGNRFWRWLRNWLWTLVDAAPPYQKVNGPLESKATDPNGEFYICVGSARIEVDRATFDTLTVGESLRVRYTRGNRAINIDRLLPENGPGNLTPPGPP